MAEEKKDTEKKQSSTRRSTAKKSSGSGGRKASAKSGGSGTRSSTRKKETATRGKGAAEATSKTADSKASETATSKAPAKKAAEKKPAAEKPDAKQEPAKKPAAKSAEQTAATKTAAESKTTAKRTAKKEAPERPVVSARARFVRVAPRKARLIADQVRGLPLDDALPLLRFSSRSAAQDIRKLLESAAANAENNHDLVADDLMIKDIHVDEGPTLRRYRPRALGRATRINKRTSHIAVALTPED
jgi:ribosomal protein L22